MLEPMNINLLLFSKIENFTHQITSNFAIRYRYDDYKVQLVYELNYDLRFRFARQTNEKLHSDVDFPKNVIFSIVAHFDLGGYVKITAFTWSYRSQCIHYEPLFGVTCEAKMSLAHISLKIWTAQPLQSMETAIAS